MEGGGGYNIIVAHYCKAIVDQIQVLVFYSLDLSLKCVYNGNE